ncbi:MAG TPA: hypothetical protein VJS88_02840, partial [Chthoniobacterales bacterium]|nr:hypothetical protein [Chthoniobacterales bacterium]
MKRFGLILVCASVLHVYAEPPTGYRVYVTNERSGDLSVIDGATDALLATYPVGKRPRGIQAQRDGTRVLVALSGSPRMAPGVDAERAP